MTETIEQARARSEASGRTRSQMRCDSCAYLSAGSRCNRALSRNYSLRVNPENYCQQWEPKT